MSVAQAHNRLGHCSNDIMKKTAKHLGWELTGSLTPCKACAAGKAKQKNVPKTKDEEVTDKLMRIHLDIMTVKPNKDKPKPAKPVWRIMVDEKTQLQFSDFFASKDEMVEPTGEQLKK